MAYRALGAFASLYWSQATSSDPFWRSKHNVRPVNKPHSGFLLFSGNSNRALAEEVSSHLGTTLGQTQRNSFANGEVFVRIYENLRGGDAVVIQSICPPVNENLVELLLTISAIRRSSAERITAVIPYYAYARQDRKITGRVPISAADVARMLKVVGVDQVVSCDLHCDQIQGFFDPGVPVDNLDAGIVGIEYFAGHSFDNLVIVSPDVGGVNRAKRFLTFMTEQGFNPGLAMIAKQRGQGNELDDFSLVGEVEGRDVIIVDDIIDTGDTLCAAAETLKAHGAKRIFAYASHGLFSQNALKNIEASPLTEVVVTNTIPLRTPSPKVVQVSVGVLLAEAIRRIHQKESMSELFKSNN